MGRSLKLFAASADIRIPYYIMEDTMDYDDFDDFEGDDEYDDFDDEDRYFNDDIENDIDDISDNIGSGDSEKSRTGIEWYEIGLLGALADELSEEKKQRRRRVKDRNNPKRKT
jgi:hypothetical protein